MAISNHVNTACNNIHDVIQSSGLHFLINQTPWSSFITIRKKFIDPNQAAMIQPFMEASSDYSSETFAKIMAKCKQLEQRNIYLEEALVNVEDESKVKALRNEEVLDNLHGTIDHMERKVKDLETQLTKKETEATYVKKVIATKEEIIQKINKSFNQKVRELDELKREKVKEEKEAIKKEKKAKKKLSQKLRKSETKFDQKEVLAELLKQSENENNNEEKDDAKEDVSFADVKAEAKADVYKCKYCDQVAKSRNDMEDHVMETHLDRVGKLVRKFEAQNSVSQKLLADVPESEYIFTPEEITHLSVDWKIHMEILKIMEEQKI